MFPMCKCMVFLGGAYAHMTSLKNLSQFKKLGNQVTSISSSLYRYTGMGHGILSRIYHIWEVRFHVKKLAEDQAAIFIKGKALRLTLFGTFFFRLLLESADVSPPMCVALTNTLHVSHFYSITIWEMSPRRTPRGIGWIEITR
jgi:hypothetical protein